MADSGGMSPTSRPLLDTVCKLGTRGKGISVAEARSLISAITRLFAATMIDAGHDGRQITRITTKFRDAGRRSPPWKPASSRVPGRPQDGADGNRTLRWLLDKKHKFYADELQGTLVEVKYYLQALSMEGAPKFPEGTIQAVFHPWLIEHSVEAGQYLDPVQRIPINLHDVVNDARTIQSGHFVPLDRGGRHEPSNAFLMLARSNQLQGNLTLDELLRLMETIVARHKKA
jgi:hypothetical protein